MNRSMIIAGSLAVAAQSDTATFASVGHFMTENAAPWTDQPETFVRALRAAIDHELERKLRVLAPSDTTRV